jgi:hypothetical protein
MPVQVTATRDTKKGTRSTPSGSNPGFTFTAIISSHLYDRATSYSAS